MPTINPQAKIHKQNRKALLFASALLNELRFFNIVGFMTILKLAKIFIVGKYEF